MNEKINTKEHLIRILHDLRQEHDKLVKSYETLRTEVRKDEELILKLLTAINTTSDAIFLTDIEGIITYINSGFTTLYGYTSDEVVGKVTPRIIKSGLLDKEVYESFWKTLKNKTEIKGEILNKRKNGELVIIDSTASPVFDEQNSIIGFLGIQRDINERKQTEKALQESEKKFRTLVEYVGEGIGFVSPDEEFLFANSAAERIFGVGSGELLGKNLKKFLNEDQYMRILNQTKIRTKRQNSIYEFELTRTDGEKRNVLITAVPQFNDNNKFIGTHGIFRDFTEQKRTEKALQESEEKFRSIMENSADAIFITNQQGKYVYTNKAVSVLLGYTEDEMKSKTIIDLSPKNKIDEYFEMFKRILSEGKVFDEIELLKKDGNFISTDLNAVLLTNGLVYGSCRNITDRKKAERDLAKSLQFNLQIINSIDEGILVYDRNLRFTVWNPFMENYQDFQHLRF